MVSLSAEDAVTEDAEDAYGLSKCCARLCDVLCRMKNRLKQMLCVAIRAPRCAIDNCCNAIRDARCCSDDEVDVVVSENAGDNRDDSNGGSFGSCSSFGSYESDNSSLWRVSQGDPPSYWDCCDGYASSASTHDHETTV